LVRQDFRCPQQDQGRDLSNLARFSEFVLCLEEKVSCLLQQRNRGNLEIFPLLLRDCFWDEHYWLKRLQMLPALEGMLAKSWLDWGVFFDKVEQVPQARLGLLLLDPVAGAID